MKQKSTANIISEALNHKELEKHYNKLLDIIIQNQGFTHKGKVFEVKERTIKIKCPKCEGTGMVFKCCVCPMCNGEGIIG